MAKQETKTSKRASMSDVTLQFGLMSMQCNIYSPLKTKPKSGFHQACPVDARLGKAVGVSQRYVCKEHAEHGSFLPAECEKYADTDDGPVLLDKSEIVDAKTSELPEKLIQLTAHKASEVLPYLVNSDKGLILLPKQGADSRLFSLFFNSVTEDGVFATDSGDIILMATARFRKEEKVVYLTKHNNHLILQHIFNPEDVDEVDTFTTEVDPAMLVQFKQVVESGVETFDPEVYSAKVRERYADLIERTKSGEVKPKPAAKSVPMADLTSMLQAALDANLAKKGN